MGYSFAKLLFYIFFPADISRCFSVHDSDNLSTFLSLINLPRRSRENIGHYKQKHKTKWIVEGASQSEGVSIKLSSGSYFGTLKAV